MAQNVYDDDEFFAAYSGLRRSLQGLDGAPEWPTLRSMLPPMPGLRVVDLGCGFGWFSRWAAGKGAASVLAMDVSEKMLARAVADTSDERITYRRQDLETAELPAGAFDVAYSSLALHYLEDLDRILAMISNALVPNGTLVFSVEHPIYSAPSHPEFMTDSTGHVSWPLDRYHVEGLRTTDWLTPGVQKYHRTVGTYVSSLLHAGFVLQHLCEWAPTAEEIDEFPEWSVELERPQFLLLGAQRA